MAPFARMPLHFGLISPCSGFIKGYSMVHKCITFISDHSRLKLAIVSRYNLRALVRWCGTQHDTTFYIVTESLMMC